MILVTLIVLKLPSAIALNDFNWQKLGLDWLIVVIQQSCTASAADLEEVLRDTGDGRSENTGQFGSINTHDRELRRDF